MGNPWCPNCKTISLKSKLLNTGSGKESASVTNKIIRIIRPDTERQGKAKFWVCSNCKKKWRRGSEILREK